jgi:hypothetical protein
MSGGSRGATKVQSQCQPLPQCEDLVNFANVIGQRAATFSSESNVFEGEAIQRAAMPQKKSAIARNSVGQEGRILLAASTLEKKEILAISKTARIFNVPRSTLRDRLKGSKYRNETDANGHKMTQIEEESVIRWILSMDQ